MHIFECEGQYIVYDWNMTPQGWCARTEWFDTYEEALAYVEKNLL